jgi:hypothetical protein
MSMTKSFTPTTALVLGLAATACQVRPYDVVTYADASPGGIRGGAGADGAGGGGIFGSTGGRGGSTGRGDGGPGGVSGGSGPGRGDGGLVPGCMKRDELCNGIDDDCDGVVDNGYDFMTDVAHCGRCGNVCSFSHSVAACVNGACAIGMCQAQHVDVDKKNDNGCECLLTNAGKEICDGADNDCNGTVDDGFNFMTDIKNCGGCNNICEYSGAAALCAAGKCALGACVAGRLDLDKMPANGCEYSCTPTNGGKEICDGADNDCNGMADDNPTDVGKACGGKAGGVGACAQGMEMCVRGQLLCVGAGVPGKETCNGVDDDCDGMTDEEDPLLGASCFPVGTPGCNVVTGMCSGPCKLGKWACTMGKLACDGSVGPKAETCDDVDNDCDGMTDEDFDKATDPRTCGGCNTTCTYANAVPLCQNRACVRGPCAAGWVDADGNAANGCEYQCTPDNVEVCDGKDNDCNGKIDEADPGLIKPIVNFCLQLGACSGAMPACKKPNPTDPTSKPDWICSYPPNVQTVPGQPNMIVADETWCDGIDNDCDGARDEHIAVALGSQCSETATGLGECQRRGVWRCNAADRTAAATCDYGSAAAKQPEHEICDGNDNDCDGIVDESWDNPADPMLPKCAGADCRGIRDAIVQVGSAYVHQYEASRVDADATSQGSSEARACSRSGVVPWSVVNFDKAAEACGKAGMRLCKANEWEAACKGSQTCTCAPAGQCTVETYPYGCTFSDTTCNGAETNKALPGTTGTASCVTPGTMIYDMSGNVAEWVDDQRGTVSGTTTKIYGVRGGSISTFKPMLACETTKLAFAQTYAFIDTGFRCCTSCPAGQADCGGAGCKNLANDSANCGACNNACPGGQTCRNGKCS